MVPLARLATFAILPLSVLWASPASPAAADDPAQPVTVQGTILDRSSGQALEGVRLSLEPAEGASAEVRMAVTDSDGRFAMREVPEGRYTLEARHIGYGPLDYHFELPGDEDVHFDIQLVPDPIELDAVVATGAPEISPRMRGFYDRKDRGIGRFISRSDIEARNPFRVSDLFRTMAGVRVQPGPGNRGGRLLMRRGCEPAVYIDGIRTTEGARYIDDYVSTGDVEAVEVYNVSQVPAQFDQGTCGVVALWTRPPGTDPDEGNPWSWRRALVALSVMGFILLR